MNDIALSDTRPGLSIHGSCVTRDFAAFEHWEVAHYQARSSMCTKASPPLEFDMRLLEAIPQPWGRRMVEWDLCRYRLDCSGAQLLLIDLIDEREAVLDFSGALVTESVPFTASSIAASLGVPTRKISRESEEYWRLFEEGCRWFADGLTCPVILHDARWATAQRVDGDDVPLDDAPRSVAENAMLERLLSIAGTIFQPIGTLCAAELAVADPQHRWGLAPFHYIAEYYTEIGRQLLQLWEPHRSSLGVRPR